MPPTAGGPRVYTGALAPLQPPPPSPLAARLRSMAPWRSAKSSLTTEATTGSPPAARLTLPPAKRPAEGAAGPELAKRPRLPPPAAPNARILHPPLARVPVVANPLRPSLAPPPSLGTILRLVAANVAEAEKEAEAEAVPAKGSEAEPQPEPEGEALLPLKTVEPFPLPPVVSKPPLLGLVGVLKALMGQVLGRVLPEPAGSKDDLLKPKPDAEPTKGSLPPANPTAVAVPVGADKLSNGRRPGQSAAAIAASFAPAGLADKPTANPKPVYRFGAPPMKLSDRPKRAAAAPATAKPSGGKVAEKEGKKKASAFPKPARKARHQKMSLAMAEKKAQVVPIELCAVAMPEFHLGDPNAVDPKSGIRYAFLRILYPEEERYKLPPAPPKPKVYRPKGHVPDPQDRLFPKPLVFQEPAYQKRVRKSNVLRNLTESDILKLGRFHITWDCTKCLRTFTDKNSLAIHKPLCRQQRLALEGGSRCHACQFCKRGFPNESVLISHKQHEHADLWETKTEVWTEELRQEIDKIENWVDKCCITVNQVENCMNSLHQLYEMLLTMKVYLNSDVPATRQLAGREMMVMIDAAVKAAALGCSTSAASVNDITSANPTVVAGLFHAIAHLEGFGLLPGALRRRVDDTRRKRNIVFHTLGVVLDDVALERQCALAFDVMRWAEILMDRTMNVVMGPRRKVGDPNEEEEDLAPRRDILMEVEDAEQPYDPTKVEPASLNTLSIGADVKLGSVPFPTLPVGVSNLGNQSGIPAWKYTAPAIPILNKASVLLGAAPSSNMMFKK